VNQPLLGLTQRPGCGPPSPGPRRPSGAAAACASGYTCPGPTTRSPTRSRDHSMWWINTTLACCELVCINCMQLTVDFCIEGLHELEIRVKFSVTTALCRDSEPVAGQMTQISQLYSSSRQFITTVLVFLQSILLLSGHIDLYGIASKIEHTSIDITIAR
jgi:hypothetical protein